MLPAVSNICFLQDMIALYEYSHYGSATLDCVELYLRAAKWELEDVTLPKLSAQTKCVVMLLLHATAKKANEERQ